MRRRFSNKRSKSLGDIKYMYYGSNGPEDRYDPSRAESFLGLDLPARLFYFVKKI